MSPHTEDDSSRASKPSDRSVSEFLLRACHDLRAHVRTIRAHTELVLRQDAATQLSDHAERLAFVIDGARRIEQLADGLVNYSLALEIDRASFQPTRVDIALRGALARLEKEVTAGEAKVSYGDLPRVVADPDRLMQLFEQLLRNAIDGRGEAPLLIQVAAEKRSGEWLFKVQDNGVGVEARYLETIFRPFERLDGRKNGRPGLGLTICREIVARHGGRIWAESKPGEGSTFLFTLPAE